MGLGMKGLEEGGGALGVSLAMGGRWKSVSVGGSTEGVDKLKVRGRGSLGIDLRKMRDGSGVESSRGGIFGEVGLEGMCRRVVGGIGVSWVRRDDSTNCHEFLLALA